MKRFWICMMAVCLAGMIVSACGGKGSRQNPVEQESQQEPTTEEVVVGEPTVEPSGEATGVSDEELIPQGMVDFETYMRFFDRVLADMSDIHIREAADTLKLQALEKKYDAFDNLDILDETDDLTHSQRVHYLRSILDYFKEMERLGNEMLAVGIEGAERMLLDQEMIEAKELFEKEYEREMR